MALGQSRGTSRKLFRGVSAGLVATLLAGAPARANDSSKGSGGSNDSSKNSGDSSKNSGDSSQNSGKGSEDSTQNSPKNSTKGTSDESTNSKGGAAISIGLALVVVGASVVGGVFASRSSSRRERAHTQALMRFLQRNHALVTRDVVLAEGPLLATWSRDLGLADDQRDRLGAALDGSPEQAALLDALDGPVDEARAQRFAAGFAQVGRRALGDERFRRLVLAAHR
jgi:hypothetical protein